MTLAAAPGFSFGDPYALVLLFVGLAVFVAVAALSHEAERAFSAALVYLGLGLVAALVIGATDVRWLNPIDDASLIERGTEFAVVVALFGTGLKLDRPFARGRWGAVVRLLAVVMPLTIVSVAAFGTEVMGISLAAAIALGAALAPTDPVLAGDVGVGPPGEEDERPPNFAITAEAGLNDGLAAPFALLGLGLAVNEGGRDSWLAEWFLADVLYGCLVGVAIGVGVGYGFAAAIVPIRDRGLIHPELDRWIALASVLAIYGITEAAGAYGFLAAFAGGIAFRRYERDHELNARVHEGAETLEKLAELGVILLLGSMVTIQGLERPGWSGWLLVPLLLLAVRPLVTLGSFLGSPLPRRERLFLAWFGIRGIGTLYYAALILASGALADREGLRVYWTAVACILCSILLFGVTGSPLTRRLLKRPASRERPIGRRS